MAAAALAIAPRGPDILIRTAPPLSAVKDAPLAEVAKPPASASNAPADIDAGIPAEMSPQEQAAARTAKVVDPDEAAEAKTAIEQTAADKKKAADLDEPDTVSVDGKDVALPPWMKREITKARNRQREAEASAKTAAEELAAIRATVEELKSKVEPAKAADPVVETVADARPTRDKFDDPDAYDTALTEWATREGVRQAEAKIATEKAEADAAAKAAAELATKAEQEAQLAKINADWEAQKAVTTEKYPDFEAVVMSDKVLFSPPMAQTFMLLPNGSEIAYTMAQDAAEVARIAALPVALQLVEIGKVASRLATPVRATPRPRPLEPIDTNFGPADTSDREPDMDSYGAKRTKEILSSRQPFMDVPERSARH